jgi:hypothetical protein
MSLNDYYDRYPASRFCPGPDHDIRTLFKRKLAISSKTGYIALKERV